MGRSEKKVRETSEYTIKSWASEERPREKLERHGPGAITNAELLAILIGSGTQGITAVDVSKALLNDFHNIRELARAAVQELTRYKGVGKVKAIKLVAAFEIARRIEAFQDGPKARIQGPEDVVKAYQPHLRDLTREVFKVILLDGANQVIRDVTISEGVLNASLVHPREVFKAAVDERAASIILMHNHPSGHCDPSAEDLAVTEQLRQAGKLMGIPVRDHIIVAGKKFTSLAKLGHL